ncbi:MAG: hypothetical protein Q9167_004866 [Letrouitia subvulpina]
MDGLSIAGSLVAVAAAGYHISVKLTTLATQMDTASERISLIGSDVSLTSNALQQLGELMNQKGTEDCVNIFSQSSLETTRTSATTCQDIFKEIEQAIQSASEQIRGKGKLVGEKIKLSKFEKLKWPFLQPKFDIFRRQLQDAKGTLMLMLQIASLFFSKKMAEIHQSTSATLIEQRDIVHAILTLQTEQRMARDDSINRINSNDSYNTTPADIQCDSTMKQLPNPPDDNSMIAMMTPINPTTRSVVHDLSGMTPVDRHSRHGDSHENHSPSNTPHPASPMPTLKVSEKDHNKAKPFLDLFLLQPMVRDVGEIVELSWHVRKQYMTQSRISAQLARDMECSLPVDEMYESLYDHEHRTINSVIEKINPDGAKLLSLKREYSDLRHREMIFHGVPSLRFIIERGPIPPVDLVPRRFCSSHQPSPLPPIRQNSASLDFFPSRNHDTVKKASGEYFARYTSEVAEQEFSPYDSRKADTEFDKLYVDEVFGSAATGTAGFEAGPPDDIEAMQMVSDDKSSQEQEDVQRMVEQLLSKYTTIFEKGPGS